MTKAKGTKATEPSVEEVAAQAADSRCAERIQEVLEQEGRALQPFMSITPHGILPSVRLVEVPAEENAEPKESEGADKEGSEE